MGQGEQAARDYLKANPDIAKRIEERVTEACLRIPAPAPTPEDLSEVSPDDLNALNTGVPELPLGDAQNTELPIAANS
jgi:hypothetical protein